MRRGRDPDRPRSPQMRWAAWLGRSFLGLVGGLLFWLLFAGVAHADGAADVPDAEWVSAAVSDAADAAGTDVPEAAPAHAVTEALDDLTPAQPDLPDAPPTGVDEVDGAVGTAEGGARDAARKVWPQDTSPTGAPKSRAVHRAPVDRDSPGEHRAGAADCLSEVDILAASAGVDGSRAKLAEPGGSQAPRPYPGGVPEPVAYAPSGPGQAAVLCFAAVPGLLAARGQRRRRSGVTRSRSARPAASPD